MEKNNWKIATICLVVLCIGLFTFSIITEQSMLRFGNNNFEISKDNFNKLISKYEVGDLFTICNFNHNCINIKKIE